MTDEEHDWLERVWDHLTLDELDEVERRIHAGERLPVLPRRSKAGLPLFDPCGYLSEAGRLGLIAPSSVHHVPIDFAAIRALAAEADRLIRERDAAAAEEAAATRMRLGFPPIFNQREAA